MEHYGLYEKALMGTLVTELRWDEAKDVWRCTTDQGDDFTANFAVINFGVFTQPKVPEGRPRAPSFKERRAMQVRQ